MSPMEAQTEALWLVAVSSNICRDLRFQDHLRDGLIDGVRNRERGVFHSQPGREFRRLPVKNNVRASPRHAHNLAIAPPHSVVPARSQSFHRSLLGSKAGGVTLHAVGLRVTIAYLAGSVYPFEKPALEALDRFAYARNFRDVDASAYDHGKNFQFPTCNWRWFPAAWRFPKTAIAPSKSKATGHRDRSPVHPRHRLRP